MFWHFSQISLHLSAEMADLLNVDYLSMFVRSLFGEYCEGNIVDVVMLLNFPMSKLGILDLFCFEGISSLFCASFFLASKLLRMSFAVSPLSFRTLGNLFACLAQFRYCPLSAVKLQAHVALIRGFHQDRMQKSFL